LLLLDFGLREDTVFLDPSFQEFSLTNSIRPYSLRCTASDVVGSDVVASRSGKLSDDKTSSIPRASYPRMEGQRVRPRIGSEL